VAAAFRENPHPLQALAPQAANKNEGGPLEAVLAPIGLHDYTSQQLKRRCGEMADVTDLEFVAARLTSSGRSRMREHQRHKTAISDADANGDPIVRWKAFARGAAAFFIKPKCGDEFLAGVQSAFAAN
jgi:hypothetical protein